MIRYSTNWMGPYSKQWYTDRGLTPWTYSAGRIDVRGTGDPYGEEIPLDPMHIEDWYRFSEWLRTFETDFVWSLEDLVMFYEKANPKIRWYEDNNTR